MRYLKLFEAFESETISKVMKFVNSKIGRNDKARFRRSLIDVLKSFNIPIDKIKESNVSYLNKSKALKILGCTSPKAPTSISFTNKPSCLPG
jgi:hypothetical protein